MVTDYIKQTINKAICRRLLISHLNKKANFVISPLFNIRGDFSNNGPFYDKDVPMDFPDPVYIPELESIRSNGIDVRLDHVTVECEEVTCEMVLLALSTCRIGPVVSMIGHKLHILIYIGTKLHGPAIWDMTLPFNEQSDFFFSSMAAALADENMGTLKQGTLCT